MGIYSYDTLKYVCQYKASFVCWVMMSLEHTSSTGGKVCPVSPTLAAVPCLPITAIFQPIIFVDFLCFYDFVFLYIYIFEYFCIYKICVSVFCQVSPTSADPCVCQLVPTTLSSHIRNLLLCNFLTQENRVKLSLCVCGWSSTQCLSVKHSRAGVNIHFGPGEWQTLSRMDKHTSIPTLQKPTSTSRFTVLLMFWVSHSLIHLK